MNKSAMFRSKLSFPNVSFGHGPSSVELPVETVARFIYAIN